MSAARRARFGQFLRFLIVGGSAAVSGWILLYVLVHFLRWNYLVAYATSFLAINAASYLAAGSYAFRTRDTSRRGLIRYYSINLVSLVGNGLALAALVEWARMNYLFAAMLLSALNAPINFLLHRRLTFGIGWRDRGAAS
jgi:putative flippase GtrA